VAPQTTDLPLELGQLSPALDQDLALYRPTQGNTHASLVGSIAALGPAQVALAVLLDSRVAALVVVDGTIVRSDLQSPASPAGRPSLSLVSLDFLDDPIVILLGPFQLALAQPQI
jgi:hypothetical protein